VEIRIRRVYAEKEPGDGVRVLVDRLWPRGLSKARADVDEWMPEVAPSPALRKWFGHDPARFAEFGRRYREELAGNPEPVERLREMASRGALTLVYAARDPVHNHAAVLGDAGRGVPGFGWKPWKSTGPLTRSAR
jgi:uncharacterized protein YeaO (DUF488 family)